MDSPSLKRPLMISALLILVLIVGTWFSDVMVAIMVCMLVVAWQALRLLYYAVCRNMPALKLTAIRLLLWMATAVGMGAMIGHYSDRARAQGDTLVAALQVYRAREGRYPEQLEALAPRDVAAIPMVATTPIREGKFLYRSNGNTFSLIYITGFRMGASYDSGAAKWEALD